MVSFLLSLLFLMHIGLMGSSAYAHHHDQDKGTTTELASLTGGRKMMMMKPKELKMTEDNIVKEGISNLGATGIPKISGKDHTKASHDHSLLGISQEALNTQEPVQTEEESSEDDDDNHDLMNSSTDETRRLLEAAKEIVSLMHKDYKGMGRRKPPINNHEPSH